MPDNIHLDLGATETLLTDANCVKLAVDKTLEELSVKHLQMLKRHFNRVNKKSLDSLRQIRATRAIKNIKEELKKRGIK